MTYVKSLINIEKNMLIPNLNLLGLGKLWIEFEYLLLLFLLLLFVVILCRGSGLCATEQTFRSEFVELILSLHLLWVPGMLSNSSGCGRVPTPTESFASSDLLYF